MENMSDMNNEAVRDFQELKYPHVEPDDICLDYAADVPWKDLTRLERAFVRWYLETGDPRESMRRVIHPAHFFDTQLQNEHEILRRPTVREFLLKAKKLTSHLRFYTNDRLAALLHEEIQHLRISSRNKRYRDEPSDAMFGGKKSLHEEEVLDTDLLLKCLDMVVKLKETSGIKDGVAEPGTGGPHGGVAGLNTEVEKLIGAAKGRSRPDPDEGDPE